MVGSDINKTSVIQAIKNVNYTKGLSEKISIKHQENNANIFEGIINENDQFTFTMCNPPFYTSEKDAEREALKKLKNLNDTTELKLNFGGIILDGIISIAYLSAITFESVLLHISALAGFPVVIMFLAK